MPGLVGILYVMRGEEHSSAGALARLLMGSLECSGDNNHYETHADPNDSRPESSKRINQVLFLLVSNCHVATDQVGDVYW